MSETPPSTEEVLRRVSRDLTAIARPWAVVGGLAVSVRAEPRFTRDVDVAIGVASDDEALAVVSDLTRRGYTIQWELTQKDAHRIAGFRMVPPGSDPDEVVLDLLFASSGLEPALTEAAEDMELAPGLRAPVAARGHLIALKVLARDDDRRPQDLLDLKALLETAGPEDLALAREAVAQIEAAGYHRGRDLGAGLEEVVSRFRRR